MTSATRHSHPLAIHPSQAPESVYRRFFLTGILVMVTAGAAWGTWLLWQIGQAGSFTDVSIHAVNAHGHAQVFGWVGLFIMGFAYQAFPRIWGVRLAAPHLALAAFLLMFFGLLALSFGQWRAETWEFAVSTVTVGGFMQIVAAAFFGGQIIATYFKSRERFSPALGFIFIALFWFVAMTAANLWHTMALMTAESREALLHQIATYQAALRDMQIHGLALFMILGVAMRFFPGMFGLPQTSAWRGWTALILLTVAVVGEVTLLVSARVYDSTALAGLLLVPWTLLAVGCALIVWPWRLWRPMPMKHRSTKFVRTAFAWLGISLLMLLLLPVYTAAYDMQFSHAYYGAVRHAITVGFVSMMIMGVSARVVPELRGFDHRRLSALWGPFILVNAGCVLRVTSQILTDWFEVTYAVIAFSGVLELAGFAWWGIGIAILMFRKPRGDAALPASASESARRGISPSGQPTSDAARSHECTCCQPPAAVDVEPSSETGINR